MRLSQPTETVRVPVSRRPMVCGVVGGAQALATSSSVIPRARRTSLIRVIIDRTPSKRNQNGFSLSYRFADVASRRESAEEIQDGGDQRRDCLLEERSFDAPMARQTGRRPARSVTVNLRRKSRWAGCTRAGWSASASMTRASGCGAIGSAASWRRA